MKRIFFLLINICLTIQAQEAYLSIPSTIFTTSNSITRNAADTTASMPFFMRTFHEINTHEATKPHSNNSDLIAPEIIKSPTNLIIPSYQSEKTFLSLGIQAPVPDHCMALYVNWQQQGELPFMNEELTKLNREINEHSCLSFDRFKLERRKSFLLKIINNECTKNLNIVRHGSLQEAEQLVHNLENSPVAQYEQGYMEMKKQELVLAREILQRRGDYRSQIKKLREVIQISNIDQQNLIQEKVVFQHNEEYAKFVADNTKLPENPYADIIDKQKEEVVQAVHNEYVDKSLSLDHALQELQKIGVDNPAHYTKATVAFFENMEKQGLLKAFDEDTYQEILQDGLITFFHNIVPENPLHNPKESLKTACSIAAWSVLYTLPPVWCVKLTEAIMIAEQVYTICAQDYANMTPRQRAVLFGKTMAEALKAFGADKAMNVATKKVLKIPFGKKREGFHTQSSPSQPVEHSEIVTTDGTKFKVSHIEESLHLQENSNNQKFPKNTPKNVVKATITDQKPVEWANYLKHRPPQNISWKDIVKSTTNGHAKYHPNVNIKDLELHAWKYGQPTTNGKNWKVFKNDKIIGANSGKETCYIRVECSANTIHGHPILESDYLRYLK